MNLYLDTGILASALVREYLHRKGLTRTLDVLDEEFPRETNSINKTSTLVRELNLELLFRANKLRKFPFCSLVEMIVYNIKSSLVDSKEKKIVRNFNTEVENYKSDNKKLSMLQLKVLHEKLINRGINIDFVKLVKINCGCMYSVNRESHRHDETGGFRSEEKEQSYMEHSAEKEAEEGTSVSVNDDSFNGSEISNYEEIKGTMIKPGGNDIETLTNKHDSVNESLELEEIIKEVCNYIDTSTSPLDPSNENLVLKKYSDRKTNKNTQPDVTQEKILKNDTSNELNQQEDNDSEEPDFVSTDISEPKSFIKVYSGKDLEQFEKTIKAKKKKSRKLSKEKDLTSQQIMDEESNNSMSDAKHVRTSGKNRKQSTKSHISGKKQQLERDERGEAMDGFDRYEYTKQTTQVYKEKVESPLKEKEAILLSAIKDKDETTVEELDPETSLGSEQTTPESNNNNGDSKRNLLNCFKSNGSSDRDEDPLAGFIPVEQQVWADLMRLLIGPDRKTPIHWINQSFVFNNPKLRYAFLQYKGGCCGILAPVQAYLIKVLLFSSNGTVPEPLRPTELQAKQALIQALTDILWQAGRYQAVLALTTVQGLKSLEEIRDNLIIKDFRVKSELKECVTDNLDYFTMPSSAGCLLLVISAILSRGITNAVSDMDEESWPLIGSNDFCSLEVLNLLLTGLAVSNVFDNSLQVDSCTLRGVSTRADIGFLSLYEHYNSCQVGSNLKTPRFPIWVVNCENHFTVLFSCNKDLVSDWRAERLFDLYHYDGYHTATEEIKLSLDTRGLEDLVHKTNEPVPPLEHCIRTKWKGAIISWSVNK